MRRVASLTIPRLSLTTLAGSVLAVAMLAGCPDRPVSKVDPTPVKEEFKDIPVEVNRDIDILFVVDNSGSMLEEQTSLAQNFVRFIEVLENIEGGLPNVHMGVVSTDVGAGPYAIPNCGRDGDNGVLQNTARGACSPPTGAYIVDVAQDGGGRMQNYSGSLADTFACIARLGTDGCGFEQPLESIYRALNGSNPTNSGFLRPDAFLAVIIISDEDDCSTERSEMFDTSQTSISDPLGPLSSFRCFEFGVKCEPDDSPRQPGPRQNCTPRNDSEYMYSVDRYIQFLKGLKADPSQIIVAGIIGNATPVTVGLSTTQGSNNPQLQPSCSSASGEAAPGVRLKYFLDGFSQRNTSTTICNDNLADALVLVAELLSKVISNPCLAGNLDTDPDQEGVQEECQVSDVRFPSTDLQQETIIPKCSSPTPGAGELPCWHLVENADCTETETGLSLAVERGEANVPSGTHVQARCVVR